MPWHVAKSSECPESKPWAVIKDSDGSVEGCHASEADAQSQQAALYVSEKAAPMDEQRTIKPAEVRAVTLDDGKHGLTVQAINTRTVDDYGSLWDARAFDDHLEQAMPRLVWAHDWSEPLGPPVSFERSSKGPIVTFAFSDFDAVPMARRAHAQVKDGTLTDVSVGFRYLPDGKREPSKAERDKYPGVREVITKAAMDEVSLVLRGAVPGAKVLSVREALETAEEIFDEANRGDAVLAGSPFRNPRHRAMSFRTSHGAMIDADAVFEIARKVAAAELTKDEGDIALLLLAALDEPPPEDAPPEVEIVNTADPTVELIALEALTEGN